MYVCLSVRDHISGTAGPICTKFCGSVLFWRRYVVQSTAPNQELKVKTDKH